MGLLPEIAAGVGITIPAAGPRRLGVRARRGRRRGAADRRSGRPAPRRTVLLWLMVVFAAGNIGSGVRRELPRCCSPARFVSGLPHGAFFGIGAVVAASLVPRHRRTWAV